MEQVQEGTLTTLYILKPMSGCDTHPKTEAGICRRWKINPVHSKIAIAMSRFSSTRPLSTISRTNLFCCCKMTSHVSCHSFAHRQREDTIAKDQASAQLVLGLQISLGFPRTSTWKPKMNYFLFAFLLLAMAIVVSVTDEGADENGEWASFESEEHRMFLGHESSFWRI